MFITSTILPDVMLIEPKVFEDERGFFYESYHKQKFNDKELYIEFVQDNHARSLRGVLRGLHYQIRQPQGKLVRVLSGEVYDVALDLRVSSSSFGRWTGIYLSEQNKKQLYIPPGFAHGYYVVSELADVVYKATDYYAPEWERTLLWNDDTLNISWPLLDGQQPILSSKDAAGTTFDQAEIYD